MCDEWMKPIQLPLTIEQFHQLPRNPAYKYEYFEGQAWINPRPRFFHGLLDLGPLQTRTFDWIDSTTVFRPVEPTDWDDLPDLFTAAFHGRQPFGSLSELDWPLAARRCLERTRSGADGPWIEQASYLAFRPEGQRPIGAILITLLPDGDPTRQASYFWDDPPPTDCLARQIGRPHLTWIFVHPTLSVRGVGTAMLNAASRALLALGYHELASTFLLGNDSSMLWHWRNGFRLLTHPDSWRPPLTSGG
jgi:GNAT superfamily N-acetyltransferase